METSVVVEVCAARRAQRSVSAALTAGRAHERRTEVHGGEKAFRALTILRGTQISGR